MFSGATFFSTTAVAALLRRLCTMGARSPKADLRRAKSLELLSKKRRGGPSRTRTAPHFGVSAFQWSRRNPVLGGGAVRAFCDGVSLS